MKAERLVYNTISWIEKLNAFATSPDVEVVVEGPRDVNSLQDLGVKANFCFAIDLIKDLKEVGERRVYGKTFIILTDFDREGIQLYKKLKSEITELGGKVEELPRREYKKFGFPPMIEELSSFVKGRVGCWDRIIADLV